jgi:hypothetical protein
MPVGLVAVAALRERSRLSPLEFDVENEKAQRRWLGGRESNPDMLVQSQLSYH